MTLTLDTLDIMEASTKSNVDSHSRNLVISETLPQLDLDFKSALCSLSSIVAEVIPAIRLRRTNPLKFYEALAYALKSQENTNIAVTSFIDKAGESKLYIATKESISIHEREEMSDIVLLFLDHSMNINHLLEKILPRHLPFIFKKLQKINIDQKEEFSKTYPGDVSDALEYFTRISYNGYTEESLKAVRYLLALIWRDQTQFKSIKADGYSIHLRDIAKNFLKSIKLMKGIKFINNRMTLHKKTKSVKTLQTQFQFVSYNCHPELAILNIAHDNCALHILYIGVSKRLCQCCSLFLKKIEVSKKLKFRISCSLTNGVFEDNWGRIENFFFETEYDQVLEVIINHSNSKIKERI